MDLSPQVQDKLAQFQTLQQQLQLTSLQKQQLMAHGSDVDNALSELTKLAGGEKVYRSAGALLIESSKAESEKALNEEKELNATRMKVMERQEKKLSERYDELKKELQALIGSQQSGLK
ncbi:MAG: prefoldin subunit beta [Candidatus Altiarchaeota archaeon]|nr:prefoldin subunit beta [Candidatus Altiarchaeota archaeon]